MQQNDSLADGYLHRCAWNMVETLQLTAAAAAAAAACVPVAESQPIDHKPAAKDFDIKTFLGARGNVLMLLFYVITFLRIILFNVITSS